MKSGSEWHGQIGYMDKDMMHAVMKIIILLKIKRRGKIYPYALVKEIERIKHPFISGNPQIKNDVYNTLKALELAGYVKAITSGGNGRPKVDYTLTSKGRASLEKTKRLFRETMKGMIKILK